jgi:hypothetical protein
VSTIPEATGISELTQQPKSAAPAKWRFSHGLLPFNETHHKERFLTAVLCHGHLAFVNLNHVPIRKHSFFLFFLLGTLDCCNKIWNQRNQEHSLRPTVSLKNPICHFLSAQEILFWIENECFKKQKRYVQKNNEILMMGQFKNRRIACNSVQQQKINFCSELNDNVDEKVEMMPFASHNSKFVRILCCCRNHNQQRDI